MPLRDRELITPPPTLASLQELSGPALIAMLIASAIAVLDGLVGRQAVLIGLLAIPPVIAAMSASLPETGVVGAFCLVLARPFDPLESERRRRAVRDRGRDRDRGASWPASGWRACGST